MNSRLEIIYPLSSINWMGVDTKRPLYQAAEKLVERTAYLGR